jgi:hypothetical protein
MEIKESIDLFLEEVKEREGEEAAREYEGDLDIFVDYLISDEMAAYEDEDEEIILDADLDELEEGHFRAFAGFYVIRKIIGPASVLVDTVKRTLVYGRWLGEKGLIDEELKSEIEELSEVALKEIPRVEKISSLIYELAQGDIPTFMDYKKDREMYERKLKEALKNKPEYTSFEEGYGEVTRILEDLFWVKLGIKEVGPIKATKEICDLLEEGDMINLVLGKSGKYWHILETGNVYPGSLK